MLSYIHYFFRFLLCDVQPVESDSFKTDELRKIVYKKYVIEMELGSGSGGTVYRAYSRDKGRVGNYFWITVLFRLEFYLELSPGIKNL